MATRQKLTGFKFYDFKNFSIREAFWIAMLFHLVLLLLPESVNPFALFVLEPETIAAEPLRFQLSPAPEQDKLAAPEETQATTPERPREQPETPDPYSEGNTNLRRFQSPQSGSESRTPQPRRSSAESARRELSELLETDTRSAEGELDEERLKEMSELLGELLKQPLPPGEVPAVYNQRRPSSADPVEGMVRFDTYEWDYVPYRDRLLYKLYLYWVPKLRQTWQFQISNPGRTIYRFTIRRDGKVINVERLDPSDIIQYDMAAKYSINQPYPGLTTEFQPLPEHFPKETLTVTVGFFVNMTPPTRR